MIENSRFFFINKSVGKNLNSLCLIICWPGQVYMGFLSDNFHVYFFLIDHGVKPTDYFVHSSNADKF